MLQYEDPVWAAIYAPNGTLLVAGQTAYRPTYAKTLEVIAEKGPDAFYEGPIAEATVAAAKVRGGILSSTDLTGVFWCKFPHKLAYAYPAAHFIVVAVFM